MLLTDFDGGLKAERRFSMSIVDRLKEVLYQVKCIKKLLCDRWAHVDGCIRSLDPPDFA